MSVISIHVPDHWDHSRLDLPWHWSDDQGASGVLGNASALPAAREVRLIVPPCQALHAVVNVPRRGRWQETLAYALEDRLLDDPDRVHVAAGAPRDDGRTPVVAIDRQWLRAAVARADAMGLHPQSAFSAATLEPAKEHEWLALVAAGETVLVDDSGLPVLLDAPPAGEPPRLLAGMLAARGEGARPQRIRVRARPGIDAGAIAATWAAALPVAVVSGEPWTSRPGPLPDACINLLQGELIPRRTALLSSALSAWRPVLTLLVAALTVWLLAVFAQTWQWQREERALGARAEAALRRAFPDTRTILDAGLQMQRGLDDLRARAGVGPASGPGMLLSRVGSVADGLNVRLRHLAYANGALDLDWECADPDCATTLRTRLQQPPQSLPAAAIQTDGLRVHAHLTELPR